MNKKCIAQLADKEFYRPQICLENRLTRALVDDRKVFQNHKMVIADIGARYGFDPFWNIFSDQCIQYGFESDLSECLRLRKQYSENDVESLKRIAHHALWEKPGSRTLYVTKSPNNSSCYLPNKKFFQQFPDSSSVEVIRKDKITAITFDEFAQKEKIDFDVLKLDVQGGELPILKGAARELSRSVLAVIAEVEFVELYSRQPLFSDVDQYMRRMGFVLFDLDIRRWRRKSLTKEFDGIQIGQSVWADALYLKDPIGGGPSVRKKFDKTMWLKLIALSELFSLPDYALQLVDFAHQYASIKKSQKEEYVRLLNANCIVSANQRRMLNSLKK